MEARINTKNLFKAAFPEIANEKVMVIHTSKESDTYLAKEVGVFMENTGHEPTSVLVVGASGHHLIVDETVPYLFVHGVGTVILENVPTFLTGYSIGKVQVVDHKTIDAFIFRAGKLICDARYANVRSRITFACVDDVTEYHDFATVGTRLEHTVSDLDRRVEEHRRAMIEASTPCTTGEILEKFVGGMGKSFVRRPFSSILGTIHSISDSVSDDDRDYTGCDEDHTEDPSNPTCTQDDLRVLHKQMTDLYTRMDALYERMEKLASDRATPSVPSMVMDPAPATDPVVQGNDLRAFTIPMTDGEAEHVTDVKPTEVSTSTESPNKDDSSSEPEVPTTVKKTKGKTKK